MEIEIRFDDGETYATSGPSSQIGSFGYANLKSYTIEDGFVVMDFGIARRRIPVRRLVNITEG